MKENNDSNMDKYHSDEKYREEVKKKNRLRYQTYEAV